VDSVHRTIVCSIEFQVEGADTEKAREEKLLIISGGLEICIGRTQGSGRKIVRNEFIEVETLTGMKCFPGGETCCLVA